MWRVLLVVVVAVLAGCSGPAVVTTTAPPVASAPVPARPTGVAWRWAAPGPVHALAAAGAGVVVAGDDGVTALDGSTGRERWRYARPGAALTALEVSPDGGSVVLVHDDAESWSVTVLDGSTGAVRWDDEVDVEPTLLLTDDVVVLAHAEGTVVEHRARDLASGDDRWTRRTTPGCEQRTLAPQHALESVPVAEWCAGRTVLRGLDESTGQDRWAVDAGPSEASGGSGLGSTTDGSLVVATGPRPRLLVDPRTGTVRVRVPRTAGSPLLGEGLPQVELLSRIVPSVAGLDLTTGTAVPPPPAPCEGPSLLVLPAAVVQVCSDELGDSATVDGGAPIPLGELAPADGVPLGRPERLPEGPMVVAGPGAVAVANRSSTTVVVGLR
ncbi:PQQ-binding-like beta-propeller repeat protein [Actinomycetospora termitidis]|uniref:PQQ-binding-like beta-propeller repeat protein n=1 Tax=Actinomycetospora termitidis TaxID=3053470 RepID=A0ABT7M6J3_9PSEU|nr:PQQ-binding-like beta-propeller repeat protein [Actinomycetospora sp. Odt1-22]MDL5156274.1 PQQ-binding-like beta-propeller repeat protein [Actinomycetospora sp. Odt1-22]